MLREALKEFFAKISLVRVSSLPSCATGRSCSYKSITMLKNNTSISEAAS